MIPPLIDLNDDPTGELSEDVRRVGGKARLTARLAAGGITVPPSLVVSSPVEITPDLLDDLASWARSHAPYGLVVRSSAAVEDSTTASYAGLFASRFSPPDRSLIAAAIATVMASAASDAVAGYRRARGLDGDGPVDLAVLVQAALRPVAAGVVFAGHEATARIEATWGLSTLILTGMAPPDVVSVAPDGAVTVARIADKAVTALPATRAELDVAPGDWMPLPELGWHAKLAYADPDEAILYLSTPDDSARRCCLTAASARQISALAHRVAELLDLPAVDMEWVLDADDVVHVVQARPVTAAVPNLEPARARDAETDTRRQLVGVSASAGRAAGVTQVQIGAARPGAFPDGRILVTSSAGPELMPALIACSGVIATDAGVLCHTAIVARELGKPCVVGLHDAPTDLPTGTAVILDGTAGTVTITDELAEPSSLSIPDREGATPDGSWSLIDSLDDPGTADDPHPPWAVLVMDSGLLDILRTEPAAIRRWRSAGISALLLPRGEPAPVGAVGREPLAGYGDLHWITPPPWNGPAELTAVTPAGESLLALHRPAGRPVYPRPR